MFGKKIRDIRKKKGLKISELAELIGVTSGYVSQIERDLIEPSLPVLRKLSKAIDVPLSSMFSDEFLTDVVVINNQNKKKVSFNENNITYEFLTPAKLNNEKLPKMEVMTAELESKCKDNDDFVIHTADEFTYVLSGCIEYHIGENEIHRLQKGDGIYIPEGTPHCIYNPGEEKALMFSTISPPM